MNISAKVTDEHVLDVRFDDASLIVDLMDGRTISAPLAWYPLPLRATPDQRSHWKKAGAGYGIHWPDIDEDLSSEGLLRYPGTERWIDKMYVDRRVRLLASSIIAAACALFVVNLLGLLGPSA